jgi:hypothetical protein
MVFRGDNSKEISAIAFGKSEEFDFLKVNESYSIFYMLNENYYQDRSHIQIEVIDIAH